MLDETSANRILAEVFPFSREGFIRSQQAIETTFLPSPIRRVSLWHRWPVIRSAISFVEPALKPFREIADGCIPVSRRCENMQMIRHRNRRENSPLIQFVEHRATDFPRLNISEHRFASLDAKCNEINRALFPGQPIWNARWSAHDCQFIKSPSHRDGLQLLQR